MTVDPWTALAVAAVGAFLALRVMRGRKTPADEVAKRIGAGAQIVDVRAPAEFRSGAYPGAINIPLQELGRRAGELATDRPVVVYCASGMRSASAARLLRHAGFAHVVNAGGLADMPRAP